MAHTRRIGKYEIVKRLGQGGQGSVYLARDPALDRQVAIKVIRDVWPEDMLRARFLREARAAASLRHANIVTIYDVGEDDDGEPFIAMEYVAGDTLAAIITRADATPLTRKLRILEEICAGLCFAHRAGIVHRDIKPSNIMIDADGIVRILDFGIARTVDTSLTLQGAIMGSINYMSPEQLNAAPVDNRSDIFSVGAVGYELLSGRPAFGGRIEDGVIARIVNANPPSLSSVVTGLDPEIEAIIGRALEKDPAGRYSSMDEMELALRHVRLRAEARSPAETTIWIRPAERTEVLLSSVAAAPILPPVDAFRPQPDVDRRSSSANAAHAVELHAGAPITSGRFAQIQATAPSRISSMPPRRRTWSRAAALVGGALILLVLALAMLSTRIADRPHDPAEPVRLGAAVDAPTLSLPAVTVGTGAPTPEPRESSSVLPGGTFEQGTSQPQPSARRQEEQNVAPPLTPQYRDAAGEASAAVPSPVATITPPVQRVAAGTPLRVRILTPLHSDRVRAGADFEAVLAERVLSADGSEAFPAEAPVRGRVNHVQPGSATVAPALELVLLSLGGPQEAVPVRTGVYRVEPPPLTGNTNVSVRAILVGAAVGATVGAVAAGTRGAVVGAGIGAVIANGGGEQPTGEYSFGDQVTFRLASSISINAR